MHLFQPFLKFNAVVEGKDTELGRGRVSTLLEIQLCFNKWRISSSYDLFQPFLRFNYAMGLLYVSPRDLKYHVFQPFLRFDSLCARFLWVFKFFFGFLSSRRSV